MPVLVETATPYGLTAHRVRVYVTANPVGRPPARSGDVVRTALREAGYPTAFAFFVEVSGGHTRQDVASLDLAIALGALAAHAPGIVSPHALARVLVLGCLTRDGAIAHIPGLLAMTLALRTQGVTTVILPRTADWMRPLLDGVTVVFAASLRDAITQLMTEPRLPDPTPPASPRAAPVAPAPLDPALDLALRVAAAGGHHLLLAAPPGTDLRPLADHVGAHQPPLSRDDILAISARHEIAAACHAPVRTRPTLALPHGIDRWALLGTPRRPGHLLLPHLGVLLLDDLRGYAPDVRSLLRASVTQGRLDIPDAPGSLDGVTIPLTTIVLAPLSSCPCGYDGHPGPRCRCTAAAIATYRRDLPRDLLSLFDLVVEVPRTTTGPAPPTRPGPRPLTPRRVAPLFRVTPSARERLALLTDIATRDGILRIAASVADVADRDWILDVDVEWALRHLRLDRVG